MQMIIDGLPRVLADTAANSPRYVPAPTTFGAETNRPTEGEVQESLGPPALRGNVGSGSPEMVGQTRDGAGERNDLPVDRTVLPPLGSH